MINKAVKATIEDLLSERIIMVDSVSGGDINEAYCLQTERKKYFIKVNSAERFSDMFEREATGLIRIAENSIIKTPQVTAYGKEERCCYLLLEWVEAISPDNAAFARLGEALAGLHRATSASFGLGEDNYIGSLHQINTPHQNWSDFYINQRLLPMLKMAVDKGKLDKHDVQQFEKLFAALPSLFEEEPPSLIHGDLWSGNYLIGTGAVPYLVDPAIYYGHREMDLAMTMLFGGFGTSFYQSYQHHYPLSPGFEQRIKLWSLYPLLVHVNLFGGGYVQQLRSYVKSYL